jgi:hypothetical protein
MDSSYNLDTIRTDTIRKWFSTVVLKLF